VTFFHFFSFFYHFFRPRDIRKFLENDLPETLFLSKKACFAVVQGLEKAIYGVFWGYFGVKMTLSAVGGLEKSGFARAQNFALFRCAGQDRFFP